MSLQPDPAWRPRPNYRPRPAPQKRSGFGMLVVSGLALFGVGVGYLFMTMRDGAPGVDGIVPTIQAEATPFKIRPDNPGGVEVLHQDSTVFDNMSPESKRAKQEQLLPQPEQPDAKLLAEAAALPDQPPTGEILTARSETANADSPSATSSDNSGSVALPSFSADAPAAMDAVPEVKPEIEQTTQTPAVVEGKKTESLFVQELKEATPMVEVPAIEPTVTAPSTSNASAEAAAKTADEPKPRIEAKKAEIEKAKAAAKSVAKSNSKQQAQTRVKEPAAKSEENLDIADILAKTDAVNMAKEDKLAMVTPKAEMTKPEPRQLAKPAALGSSGGMRVQLASSPNEAAAEKLMGSISSRHAGLLRQSKLSLVRAELAGKGTFYRIQTQPMDKGAANDLCASLKAAQQSCLVVKSGSQ